MVISCSSNLKSKKEALLSFGNASPQDKDKKIGELDKQISDLENANKTVVEPKEKEIFDINSKIDELDKKNLLVKVAFLFHHPKLLLTIYNQK